MARESRTGGALVGMCGVVVATVGCTDEPPDPLPNQIDRPAAILVSPDALSCELSRLVDWRNRSGVPTRLVPLAEALARGNGSDDDAQLRDYLQAQWESLGLRYVTLGGDVAVMPMRQVHAVVDIETEDVYEEADVPTELYFADLDGPTPTARARSSSKAPPAA